MRAARRTPTIQPLDRTVAELTSETLPGARPRSRNVGIDAFRFLVMFTVVNGHIWPTVSGVPPLDLRNLPYALGHCAVPFYFIAFGYFVDWRSRGILHVATATALRLAVVFAFWFAIYNGLAVLLLHQRLAGSWGQLLAGGAGFHLWFMPALAFGAAVATISARVIGLRGTLLVVAALAALGLVRGAYHDLLGIPGAASRGGAMVAPAYVYLGMVIAERKPADRPWRYALAAVLAFAWQFAEDMFLVAMSPLHRAPPSQYTLASFAFGTAVFLFARSAKGRLVHHAARLAPFVLGIYCIHLLVIGALLAWAHPTGIAATLAASALVLLASTLLVAGVSRLVTLIAGRRRKLALAVDPVP